MFGGGAVSERHLTLMTAADYADSSDGRDE